MVKVKAYNYESAVSEAVEGTLELVRRRLSEGWYDYAPTLETVQSMAYRALIRRWNKAVVREGARAKRDTYAQVQDKYIDMLEASL